MILVGWCRVKSVGGAVAEYNYGLTLLPASFKQYDAISAENRHVQIKLTQGISIAISYACNHLLVLHLDRHKGFSEVYNGTDAPVWDQIRSTIRPIMGARGRSALPSCGRSLLYPSLAIPQIQPFPALLDGDHAASE